MGQHARQRNIEQVVKRIAIYALLCLLLVGVSSALAATSSQPQANQNQKTLDLSGVYALDKSKSDTGKGIEGYALKLEIAQRGPEITFVRRRSVGGKETVSSRTFYTDNRGEPTLLINGAPQMQQQYVKSKTKWSDDKLVTSYTVKQTGAGRTVGYEAIEEWKLSKDGETLVHTTKIIPPPSDPPRVIVVQVASELKEVFHRAH